MTRVRLPAGLGLAEGVYDFADGRLDMQDWNALREAPGVEIECARHPGQWWPTAGKHIDLGEVRRWRCPDCAWAFRQGLGGRGGTPQF